MGLIGLRMASLSALAHGSMASTGVRMDITAEATTAVTMVAATTGVGSTAADTTADADLKADAVSAGAMAVDSMVAAAFTAEAVFTEAAVSMEEAASTAVAAIVNQSSRFGQNEKRLASSQPFYFWYVTSARANTTAALHAIES
jgi:hypothetical protein